MIWKNYLPKRDGFYWMKSKGDNDKLAGVVKLTVDGDITFIYRTGYDLSINSVTDDLSNLMFSDQAITLPSGYQTFDIDLKDYEPNGVSTIKAYGNVVKVYTTSDTYNNENNTKCDRINWNTVDECIFCGSAEGEPCKNKK